MRYKNSSRHQEFRSKLVTEPFELFAWTWPTSRPLEECVAEFMGKSEAPSSFCQVRQQEHHQLAIQFAQLPRYQHCVVAANIRNIHPTRQRLQVGRRPIQFVHQAVGDLLYGPINVFYP